MGGRAMRLVGGRGAGVSKVFEIVLGEHLPRLARPSGSKQPNPL
jgi:hypothetical protein